MITSFLAPPIRRFYSPLRHHVVYMFYSESGGPLTHHTHFHISRSRLFSLHSISYSAHINFTYQAQLKHYQILVTVINCSLLNSYISLSILTIYTHTPTFPKKPTGSEIQSVLTLFTFLPALTQYNTLHMCSCIEGCLHMSFLHHSSFSLSTSQVMTMPYIMEY